MFFLPFSLLFFLFLLFFPLFFLLVPLGIINISFQKLGLSPEFGFFFFFLSLIGSGINIPIFEEKIYKEEDFCLPYPFSLFYRLPRYEKKIIAINFGGCIMPLLLSLYLLSKVSFLSVIICTFLMTLISKYLSRPVPGIGIVMPAIIPPIFSALFALIFGRPNPSPVAYISGVLGVLIGADLLNLSKIRKTHYSILSIGGAGVFDGIFLVGIIAVLLI
ncbi:MAG: DUF1614 domain-containing protein [candidate division WOR-3 bacterium]|nr:DUF1614 domain-containing protein [candidate division WOR-3 bacterium]MCX7837574.1 DUF1614 domain-containing protein [candidate division WOR-3 bacterium]MDW8114257.1 DUF1614 domain-containing protein [candidate division WOR-3 bacterium]